jgi:hypothetical protein
MHCLAAFIIGFFVWVCLFAYTVLTGGGVLVPLITGPFVVSGVGTIILAVDFSVRAAGSVITNYFFNKATAYSVVEDAYELESTTRRSH